MKYLSKEPIVFGFKGHPQFELVDERGGPAMEIPESDRCPSGRHNLKLTGCWCVAESA